MVLLCSSQALSIISINSTSTKFNLLFRRPLKESWLKSQLGHYADQSGVYILHSAGAILYVGKTTKGKWGTFGERLRREFQQSAAQNNKLHQLLAAQKSPIRAYLMDLEDISMMIDTASLNLSPERKALVLEQVLIGIYQPPGNIDLPNPINT